MCYPKPGPRCSSHARAALDDALKSQDFDSIARAREDYYLTPKGIRELSADGQDFEVIRRTEMRKEMLQAYKNSAVEDVTLDQVDEDLLDGKLFPAEQRGQQIRSVMWDEETSPETLASLYEKDSPLIKQGVAGNPSAPERILRDATKSKDPELRRAVATNGSLPEDALDELSHDKDGSVLNAVLYNPNVSPEAKLRAEAGLRKISSSLPSKATRAAEDAYYKGVGTVLSFQRWLTSKK